MEMRYRLNNFRATDNWVRLSPFSMSLPIVKPPKEKASHIFGDKEEKWRKETFFVVLQCILFSFENYKVFLHSCIFSQIYNFLYFICTGICKFLYIFVYFLVMKQDGTSKTFYFTRMANFITGKHLHIGIP